MRTSPATARCPSPGEQPGHDVPEAASELRLLLETSASGPVGDSGATALLSRLAGGALAAAVDAHPAERGDPVLLNALGVTRPDELHVRDGALSRAGATVAAVRAWVVTGRIPDQARKALGIGDDGQITADGSGTPLGTALASCGVTRRQGTVTAVPVPGGTVVSSAAILRLPGGDPVALVRETIDPAWLAGLDPAVVRAAGAPPDAALRPSAPQARRPRQAPAGAAITHG